MHLIPDRDDSEETKCTVTLSEVKFSNLSLDGMGWKPDNNVNARDVQGYSKGTVDEAIIESYEVIKSGEKKTAIRMEKGNMDSQTVAAYDLDIEKTQ